MRARQHTFRLQGSPTQRCAAEGEPPRYLVTVRIGLASLLVLRVSRVGMPWYGTLFDLALAAAAAKHDDIIAPVSRRSGVSSFRRRAVVPPHKIERRRFFHTRLASTRTSKRHKRRARLSDSDDQPPPHLHRQRRLGGTGRG